MDALGSSDSVFPFFYVFFVPSKNKKVNGREPRSNHWAILIRRGHQSLGNSIVCLCVCLPLEPFYLKQLVKILKKKAQSAAIKRLAPAAKH